LLLGGPARLRERLHTTGAGPVDGSTVGLGGRRRRGGLVGGGHLVNATEGGVCGPRYKCSEGEEWEVSGWMKEHGFKIRVNQTPGVSTKKPEKADEHAKSRHRMT
jgi:hypothetical protein